MEPVCVRRLEGTPEGKLEADAIVLPGPVGNLIGDRASGPVQRDARQDASWP